MLREVKIFLKEDYFLIRALTRVCRLSVDKVSTRLPIYKYMLLILIKQIKMEFDQQYYLSVLYRTILVTAYYSLFRIGELTKGDHPVKAVDVHIAANKDKMMFILRTSKTHGEYSEPQVIKIDQHLGSNNDKKRTFEPFELLKRYINLRRSCESNSEPFFIFRDRSPVKPHHINKILKMVLRKANFDPNYYSFHSIRSGRALDLLKLGVSVETIKKLGRWKSNAIYNYFKNYV